MIAQRRKVAAPVIDARGTFSGQPTSALAKLVETEAERAIIGAILQEPELFWSLSEQLQAPDFYWLKHRWVWYAFEQMAAVKEPIDILNVARWLDDAPQAPVKGDAAIDLLTDLLSASPNAAHAESYAAHVRDAATRLRIMQATADMQAVALDTGQDIETVTDRVNELIFAATDQHLGLDNTDVRKALERYAETMQERVTGNRRPGVASGWARWDDPVAATGGLYPGDVTVLAGNEGLGKTTWMLSFARNVLRAGYPVVFFTLEMRKDEILQILISQESGIPKTTLRDGSLTTEQQVGFAVAAARVAEWPLEIIDEFRGEDKPLTPLALRRRLRVLFSRTEIRLACVDGLWLMEPSKEQERRANDRPRAVGKIMQSLSDIAKGDAGLPLPIMITHQYTGEVAASQNVKRPTIYHLAESAGVRRNAQVIVGLWRNSDKPLTEAHILKDRSGGNQGYIGYFAFDRARSLYEERH